MGEVSVLRMHCGEEGVQASSSSLDRLPTSMQTTTYLQRQPLLHHALLDPLSTAFLALEAPIQETTRKRAHENLYLEDLSGLRTLHLPGAACSINLQE